MEKQWDEIKKLAREYAVENLKNGMTCSESVYEACIRSGALDASLDTVAISSGFGGGVANAGFTCGALSGAILANGMVYGRKDPASIPAEGRRKHLIQKVFPRYNNIVSEFIKENETGLCREIVNLYEFNDPARFERCLHACATGAEIAVKYLQVDQEEADKMKYDPEAIGINNWLDAVKDLLED